MNWLSENICDFLRDAMGGVIEYFGEYVNNIFIKMVDFNNSNDYVVGAEKFLIALGLALIGLVVIKQVLSGYLFETDYDADADPFNLIVRIAEAVAVITSSAWIFDLLFQLAKDFASDIVSSTDVTGASGEVQRLLDIDTADVGLSVLGFYFVLSVMVAALIVFMVISGLRGCELIAMKLFLPIFALDLITASRERWKNFLMGYLIAFFTYGVQILFFTISVKSMASIKFDEPQYFLGAIGWLYLAIKAPKFMEKYLYKTGVSSAASSGLRMVAQTALIAAV